MLPDSGVRNWTPFAFEMLYPCWARLGWGWPQRVIDCLLSGQRASLAPSVLQLGGVELTREVCQVSLVIRNERPPAYSATTEPDRLGGTKKPRAIEWPALSAVERRCPIESIGKHVSTSAVAASELERFAELRLRICKSMARRISPPIQVEIPIEGSGFVRKLAQRARLVREPQRFLPPTYAPAARRHDCQ